MPQIAAIDVAVDAVGLFHRVELRLVFGEDLAALGEAVVVHEDVEIIPDRLGEFGLRIHQVHDAQIGLQPCGEALETFAARCCGVRRRATSRRRNCRNSPPPRGSRSRSSGDGRRRRPRRSRAAARCCGGRGARAAGAAAAGAGCFGPVKMLSKKSERRRRTTARDASPEAAAPPRHDRAGPACSSHVPVHVMSSSALLNIPFQEACHGFQ